MARNFSLATKHCAIDVRRDRSDDKIWKILGSRKVSRSANFVVQKTPLLSAAAQCGGQAFPKVSLAVSNDSNGLERKKIGNSFFDPFCHAVTNQPTTGPLLPPCNGANYSRDIAIHEEIVAVLPALASAALPRIERRRSSSVEEHETLVTGHGVVLYQLSRGSFEGSLDSYWLSDRATIFVDQTNKSLRKRFHVPPGHINIGFPGAEKGDHYVNGAFVSESDFQVTPATASIDCQYPAGLEEYRWCWATFSQDEVIRLATLDGWAPHFRSVEPTSVTGYAVKLVRTAIAIGEAELFNPDLPTPRAETIAAFERTLLSMVAQVVAESFDPSGKVGRIAPAGRARVLRRAREVIDAKLVDGLTMSELCASVGASRRTVESAFLDALGVSPYQYVRALRLNMIRKEMLSGDNLRAPIGDIAARYGIWHLSRFASDYRRLFGQLPSESRLSTA